MAAFPKDTEDYNKLFGIFIGIEKFLNSKGKIKSLFHANEDADEMYKFFLQKNQVKVIKDELCLLVDKPYKDDKYHKDDKVLVATRANILRRLTQYLKLANANDLLFLYISTHGIIDFDDYFFIPSDGEIDNVLGTGISATTLIQALGKVSGRGIKVLMVIDTCYAGAIGFDISKYKGDFSCLLSCSPVEYSYEYLNDIEHGIFTNYLIKGLEGQASNNKEGITLGELYNYVYKNVQKEAKKQKKQQNPLLIGTMPYGTILIGNSKNAASSEKQI
jgi:uncharacterized caspase-like protein